MTGGGGWAKDVERQTAGAIEAQYREQETVTTRHKRVQTPFAVKSTLTALTGAKRDWDFCFANPLGAMLPLDSEPRFLEPRLI